MVYSMAKVAAFLCMMLLVAHVESARFLKEVDDSAIVATTHSAVAAEEPELSDIQNFGDVEEETTEPPPAVDSELYNYNDNTFETPVAQDVFYSASEDTPAQGILVNDFNSDGDTDPTTSYTYDATVREQENEEPVYPAVTAESDPATSELDPATSLSDVLEPGFQFGTQEQSPYQNSEEPEQVFAFEDPEEQQFGP